MTADRRLRVLVDLKPALDGYAGIPQESRLLFRHLSGLPDVNVEGLIQHGGRRLRPGLRPKDARKSADKQIDRLSRVVVSLYDRTYSNLFEAAMHGIERLFSRQSLRLHSYFGLKLPMTRFDPALFEDFVWRTFFSKTLSPADRESLRGAQYRVLEHSRWLMHKAGLDGLKFSDTPSYPRLRTRGFDAFLTQTPFPGRVQRGTQLIVRYHDAVPILMPHTISDKAFHQASHFHALKDNVRNGAWFSCISEATRDDLLKVFPEAEPRTFVIHNIVSNEYFADDSRSDRVVQILRNRMASSPEVPGRMPKSLKNPEPGQSIQYLLMVATIEPRKNHLLLLHAWEKLKYSQFPDLKLVLVGNTGWDQGPVLNAMKPWAKRGDLFWLNDVPSPELRVLYRHAAATVCPGLAEGFDYSGVEAMKCESPVVSSDIPVHREIYGKSSLYFNPYDVDDTAHAISRVLGRDATNLNAVLVEEGRATAARYTPENIMAKWEYALEKIK